MPLAGTTLTALLAFAPPAEGPTYAPRGNRSLDPQDRRPHYSVSASGRFGVLVGNGTEVNQPFGFGFGIRIRALFFNVERLRLGLAFDAGHTRFPNRQEFTTERMDGTLDETVRWGFLAHTDLSLGPGFEIPAGPVLVGGSFGVGLGINQFFRPQGENGSNLDDELSSFDLLLRGGLVVGVPIRNDHGVVVGAHLHKHFSSAELRADDLAEGDQDGLAIFDLVLETFIGYQAWF